jgi:hypothetical protein
MEFAETAVKVCRTKAISNIAFNKHNERCIFMSECSILTINIQKLLDTKSYNKLQFIYYVWIGFFNFFEEKIIIWILT